jgi:FtsP/CotA-like multicopper oxidase with cupredoxin domain
MLPTAPILSRRRLLIGAGAAVTCFSLPLGAEEALTPDGFQLLHARAGSMPQGRDGATATPSWGYQGAVPGPVLRVKRGEELRLRLSNELSDPIAMHWHGVRVPNPMDGTPGLTQAAVAPGGASITDSARPMPAPSGTTRLGLRRPPRRPPANASTGL